MPVWGKSEAYLGKNSCLSEGSADVCPAKLAWLVARTGVRKSHAPQNHNTTYSTFTSIANQLHLSQTTRLYITVADTPQTSPK